MYVYVTCLTYQTCSLLNLLPLPSSVVDFWTVFSYSFFDFQAKEVPGIRIFRFEHSLFFVNTEHFRTLLFKKTINPRKLKIAQRKAKEKMGKKNQVGISCCTLFQHTYDGISCSALYSYTFIFCHKQKLRSVYIISYCYFFCYIYIYTCYVF